MGILNGDAVPLLDAARNLLQLCILRSAEESLVSGFLELARLLNNLLTCLLACLLEDDWFRSALIDCSLIVCLLLSMFACWLVGFSKRNLLSPFQVGGAYAPVKDTLPQSLLFSSLLFSQRLSVFQEQLRLVSEWSNDRRTNSPPCERTERVVLFNRIDPAAEKKKLPHRYYLYSLCWRAAEMEMTQWRGVLTSRLPTGLKPSQLQDTAQLLSFSSCDWLIYAQVGG